LTYFSTLTDGGSLEGGVELDNRSGRPPTAPTNTEIRRVNVETTFSFSFTGLTYRELQHSYIAQYL